MATIPGVKISQMTEAVTLDGDEYFVFAKSGTNKKIKGSNLGVGGFISKTKSELTTLKNGSVLVPGAMYFISDRNIFIRALNNETLSLECRLLAANADYDVQGDYTDVTGFNAQLGVWYSGMAIGGVGDVVIWNNLHWKNLTGAAGTDPDGDAVNWVAVSQSPTHGYIYEIDFVEYDFANDWIQRRKDKRGNDISCSFLTDANSFGIGSSTIELFKWGYEGTQSNDGCFGNICKEGYMDIRNTRVEVFNNHLQDNAYMEDLTRTGNAVRVSLNTLSSGAYISGVSLGTGGNIVYNTLFSSASIETCTISNDFQRNTIFSGFKFKNKTVTASFTYCIIGDSIDQSETISVAKSEKTLLSTESDFNTTIVITGLTTLDLTVNNYYGDVIISTTNATESINLFANFPSNIPVRFYPATGDTITFVHNTGANQPHNVGAANKAINGTNGDWIEYTKIGSAIYQTNIGQY